jgi:hypothetical protein
MRAVIQRYRVGGNEELWTGGFPVAPRVDDFVCIDPDDASLIVEHSRLDYASSFAE